MKKVIALIVLSIGFLFSCGEERGEFFHKGNREKSFKR